MLLLVLIVVGLAMLGDGNPLAGIGDVLARITRGARLTRAPRDDEETVLQSPQSIADEMGATLDEAALARMLSSEHGGDSNLVRAAVGAAALNHARSVGKSISAVLLRAKNPDHNGKFGAQADLSNDPPTSDRYASTRFDAYAGDLELARGLLDGTIPDVTGGATNFDVPRGESDPDRVAANRAAQGLTPRFVDGIDPGYLRFWGPG